MLSCLDGKAKGCPRRDRTVRRMREDGEAKVEAAVERC